VQGPAVRAAGRPHDAVITKTRGPSDRSRAAAGVCRPHMERTWNQWNGGWFD